MQTTNQKRFYSPQFSQLSAVSVRRLAWAMGRPMPAAVDIMVKLMPSIVNSSKVCLSCKDNQKCQFCIFSKQFNPEELISVLEAVV